MGSRRWAWLLLPVPIAAAIAAVAVGFVPRARVFTPWLFGMSRVGDALFADAPMSPAQRQSLVSAVDAAGRKGAAFWGESVAVPVMCACSTPACYRLLGGGQDRGHTFFGRVLLSPRGLDAVIITHEWTHAELTRRIGGFSRVPTWFSEGLAVVASEDSRYSEEAWQRETDAGRRASAVSDLESLRQFLDHPRAYLTAAHEVRRWLSNVGRAGLLRLIDAVKAGDEFHQAYHRIDGHPAG